MATLTLKRASWCLQISRTSRLFSVSFTTALPRSSGQPRRLPHDVPRTTTHSSPSSTRPYRRPRSGISSRHPELRRAFSASNFPQAQEAGASSSAANRSSLNPQPSTTQPPTPSTTSNLASGLNDDSALNSDDSNQLDWSRSFHGLSTEAFSPEAAKILTAPISPDDVEVKPDGIVYLPEIKYRRILNLAFGPGGWGLAPRGETIVTAKAVTREYALLALGRLVSIARGEQDYFSPEGIPTAVEGCKSSALRRCCKDLGIASELWDPKYVRKFLSQHAREAWVEHQTTKKKKKIFLRKDDTVRYPYKETK